MMSLPNDNLSSVVASIIKSMGTSKSKGGIRGPEKPTLARSTAITRRLNGNPSKGPELKGL